MTTNSAGSPPPTVTPSYRVGTIGQQQQKLDPLDQTTDSTLYGSGTFGTLDSLADTGEFKTDHSVEPWVATVIEDLRREPTDRAVRARVLRLPQAAAISLVIALDNQPELLMDLCNKERGNIVCHLIEKLGPDQTFCLIKFALDNFKALSLNQSGCIALPRILQFVKPSQREVFFEAVMEIFDELIVHPFGNYVVKHFLTTKEPSHQAGIVKALIADNEKLESVATNKFGSHVMDDIFKNCADETAVPLLKTIFGNQSLLKLMVHHEYANYCIQSAFRYVNTVCDAQVQSWCVSQVIPVVASSKYQQNIMKHAVSGYRQYKPHDASSSAQGGQQQQQQ